MMDSQDFPLSVQVRVKLMTKVNENNYIYFKKAQTAIVQAAENQQHFPMASCLDMGCLAPQGIITTHGRLPYPSVTHQPHHHIKNFSECPGKEEYFVNLKVL